MKKVILILSLVIQTLGTYSQETPKDINRQGLQVGSRMPDILLGTVINNYTGKTRFSDFSGKLIILDFWSTYCPSCIAAFPHIEALQKKMGDQVQIFLVNGRQTQEQINKGLERYYKTHKFPHLPSIVDADELENLFPHGGEPYHVWIDGKGVVRVRGSELNTYNEQKIKDVLAGKSVKYLSSYISYDDRSKPLYSIIHDKAPESLQYNSCFTRFVDTLAGLGEAILNKKDSFSQTIRNTFLNLPVIQLYFNALPLPIRKIWEKIIYPTYQSDNILKDCALLFVKDSLPYLSYTWQKAYRDGRINDEVMRTSNYCYEQIVPQGLSENTQRQYMLEDLNRYFGNIYGTNGKIESLKRSCYALVRTSTLDKLHDKTNKRMYGLNQIGEDFSRVLTDDKSMLLIDETGISDINQLYMSLPKTISSLEELRKALQVYDLDIIKVERELPMLVIRESTI